jgi:hypothetical protein
MKLAVLSRIVLSVFTVYVLAPTDALRAADKPFNYTLSPVNVSPDGILAINDRGEVLIERQLVQFAQPAPLIINKEGRETAPFACPVSAEPVSPQAEGSTLNNRLDVVGNCRGSSLFGFVANLESGSASFLRYPGAQSTQASGINDLGQVVGDYFNPPGPTLRRHGYLYDPATGEYRTIDHPLSLADGGPTVLTHINNKGQMAGYVQQGDNQNARYSFIYENGSFHQVRHPRSSDDYTTFIYGLNNRGEIFGGFRGPDCHQSPACPFFYDGTNFLDVTLPLPPNAPFPPNMTVFPATVLDLGGLNDSGQFVGRYRRTLAWRQDSLGGFVAASSEIVPFVATPQDIQNNFVSFTGNNSSFQTTADTVGCPDGFAGKFSFDASLTNTGPNSLSHPMIRVAELTNGNALQNADYAPFGIGAMLSVFKSPDDAARILASGESVDVHFSICLKDYNSFTFFVDVFGLTSQ